jgi:2-(1,2-epoxy-1,2-dihydrophenyl)acetyl-CoA isomerase
MLGSQATEAEVSMSGKTVLVSKSGGITRLTLNRPDKLNALCRELFEELLAALGEAGADPDCRVVVLTGAGRAFCAGQELGEEVYRKGGPQPDIGAIVERYNPLIERLRGLPKPVVAAVNGIAAGAGASLALAADIVVARRSASFLQAFAKIGLVPDCGGTYMLPRLVGDARARGHAMLAEPLPAETAAAWGMIWNAVEDAAFESEIEMLAQKLAAAATYGLALQKQAFNASIGNTLAGQLALERDLQRLAGASPDYAEGVAAFLERRPPRFSGRKG